jgi:predicted Rossmann-fold nucleotide-binding protein
VKVAVIGSRTFPLPGLVRRVVAALPEGTIIVTGGAHGVDTVAEEAAKKLGYEVQVLVPEWSLGKIAGVARNNMIVERADEVVAFWDGLSPGTHDAICRARAMKKPLTIYGATGMRVSARTDDPISTLTLPV